MFALSVIGVLGFCILIDVETVKTMNIPEVELSALYIVKMAMGLRG